MTITDTSIDSADQDWVLAGEAWSHAATDWAYGFEPYARDAIETVLHTTGVGPKTRLLDVACGAGLAMGRAERLGATVSGIDAALGLLEIAARRAPDAELVHGTMFELPWGDDSFDVVLAFNGVWGGCDEAVVEMGRVCRPGGRIGMTFWGSSNRLDLLDYFVSLGQSGPGVTTTMRVAGHSRDAPPLASTTNRPPPEPTRPTTATAIHRRRELLDRTIIWNKRQLERCAALIGRWSTL